VEGTEVQGGPIKRTRETVEPGNPEGPKKRKRSLFIKKTLPDKAGRLKEPGFALG